MPVGGSRHYQGGGLGQVGMWACPSCGYESNTGPIEQGCSSCGAGKPTSASSAAPTPPPAAAAPDDPMVREGDEADAWAGIHPGVSVAEAYRNGYRAGYFEGLRAARGVQAAAPARAEMPMNDARTYRTVVAALSLFRDQVLVARPEEVTSGEWLSAEDTTTVISQLVELLGSQIEVAHAVHA